MTIISLVMIRMIVPSPGGGPIIIFITVIIILMKVSEKWEAMTCLTSTSGGWFETRCFDFIQMSQTV